MKRFPFSYLFLLACLLLSSPGHADVVVLGLFKGAALIEADGEQKLLKVGQQWKGVSLLEANSKRAIADVNGERMTLTVSSHITSNYNKPVSTNVRIRKNGMRQYITSVNINGRSTLALVDTGANIIAMNSGTARALAIDYEKGAPSRVTTASGVSAAYTVILREVDVGGIKVNNVQASVLEGGFPEQMLLGMSYLQHVKMSEQDGIMVLTNKF